MVEEKAARLDTSAPIAGHGEFHAAVHVALAAAAAAGSREVWLCDPDFADWPLGERSAIASFAAWAAAGRRLIVVAEHFDAFVRRHARWVAWRRDWSHLVQCRTNRDLEEGRWPTLLLAADTVSLRIADRAHHRGRISSAAHDLAQTRLLIDVVLQRSVDAFPVTTTGL